MQRLTIGILTFAMAGAVQAEPQAVPGDALKLRVPGAQIEIDTPIGTKIPMKFGHDGLVSGEAGVLGTFLGSAKDRGRWWVADNRLCIKWFRWFDAQQRCMELRLDGNKIYWTKEDGESGTGTLKERPAAAEAPAPVKAAVAPPKPAAPAAAGAPAAAEKPPVAAAVINPAPAPTPVAEAGAPENEIIPLSDDAPAAAAPSKPARTIAKAATVSAPKAPVTQKQLKPAASKPAAAAKTATASFRVARVSEDDMLNIRRGPTDRSPAIGVISSRGRGVEITGPCHADWCPIRHGNISGWVNRYYLAEDIAPPR